MTIYDISKKAGVSIATVSRVLNGSANVRPKTKKKVLDIIEQCGYTPNAFARGLGLNSMKTVGILCADCSDLYMAKALYYIEQNLHASDYHTIFSCTGYEFEKKRQGVTRMIDQRVDALILIGSNFIGSLPEDNQYLKDAASQIPILMLNASLDYPNVYCTLCDDFRAMLDVTLDFIDHGIKDILYLYNSNSFSGIQKLTGYRSAFMMRDLPIVHNLQQFFEGSHDDISAVSHMLCNLYDKGLRFSAVIASDDMLATAAVKFARMRNISIPDELSVTGYNNSLLTKCSEPELSSIDNHLKLCCSQLVKTCINVLEGNEMPQKIIFSADLIERGTTRLEKNQVSGFN